MRLNRYLASCGIASRRKCDQMIEEGKVLINARTAVLGSTLDPEKDRVTVEGKEVCIQSKSYYLFYKPVNVLTTLSDPQNRPTITDFLKTVPGRVFPVGRLDFDSEGLLLLTNDGALAHRTQHPKYEIDKEYQVKINVRLKPEDEEKFRKGITLEEGITRECVLKNMGKNLYQVIIHQGWYRQIRRMFEQIGAEVVSLKRVRIGNLLLGDLKPGQYRKLTLEEIKGLKKILYSES